MNVRASVMLAWQVYCWLAGLSVIALAIAYGIVQSIAGNDAVLVTLKAPGLTGKVPVLKTSVGGTIDFGLTTERREACPGDIVGTWRLDQPGADPLVIVTRRAARVGVINEPVSSRASIELPDSVRPGRWTYESGVDSRCPTRQRYDPLARMIVEVNP